MSVFNDEGDSSNISSSKQAQEANIHLTQKKKVIFWIYLIVIAIFFGGAIALTYNAWIPMQTFSTSDSFYFGNQISYEWTLGFIKDIIVTSNSTCPSGYQSVINFQWPGTGFGCFCNSSTNVTFVLEGYCSPSLIQKNCKNMQDQSSRLGTNWANFSNICFQRSSISMANEQKYNGNNKICGSSSSLVIMPNSQPCPIVNISMNIFSLENHTNIVSDVNNLLDPIYTTFNSTSPYSFYSYPVSKFKVSQYQFCLMDQDEGIDPNHSDFILLKQLRGCAQIGNYTVIDSMNQISFYSNNPQLQSLSSIDGFPLPSNWDYYLGFGNTPSWTYQCRHNYNKKFSMSNARAQFNYAFYGELQSLIIVMMVAIIVLGIQIFLVGLRRIVNTAVYPAGYKQKYLCVDFMIALSRYIVDFCCKAIILGISAYLSYQSFYNWNWWKSASNFNCHDGNPQIEQKIMWKYFNLYNNFFRIIVSLTFLTLLMIIVDIIHFCFIYKHELQYYLVQSQNKLLVKQQQEDLKWMQIKDKDISQGNQKNLENEEFKITMAQNLFSHQQSPPQKIKKKKKKKLFTSKKEQRQQEAKQAEKAEKGEIGASIFNTYDLDEPPFFSLDSNAQIKPPQENIRKKKK